MRYLSIALILACWSPDGYSVRDAALSVAADASPVPEAGADDGSPVDHTAVPEDTPAEAALAVDSGASDVVAPEATAPDVRHVEAPSVVDAYVDSHDAGVDVGVDVSQATPETGADVATEVGGDSPAEAGSADAARDASDDLGMDTAGVDTGAEVGTDAPWVPEASVTAVESCRAGISSCRACASNGTDEFGYCAFCPATGACSPEVRRPDGTRTALAPCPGPLMLHGENRCPIPDGGL